MSDRSHPLSDLERLVERLNDAAGGNIEGALAPSPWPPVDVVDTGDDFEVRIDVPGAEREDVDLRLSGRTLSVTVDREHEMTTEDETTVRSERRRERTTREVELPEPVDQSGVAASLSGGVLTVTLPKEMPESETHDIDIE